MEPCEPRLLLAGNVVFNEIHAHPNVDTEQVEFIELTNTGDAAVDLSGAAFTNGISYTFPAGTMLEPGEYLVVSQNPAHLLQKFGLSTLGPFTGKLANEGETVTLKNAAGVTLDQVSYGQGFPWPVTGDIGNSIELINPAWDNTVAGNWRSSQLVNAATLLASHSTWRYRKGLDEPAANWKEPGFDDLSDTVAWESGQASIGYGDADDITELLDMSGSYSSIYLRNTFLISGGVPNALTLRLYVDDGAIVYINGKEAVRAHVNDGAMAHDSLAQDHEAAWETFVINDAASLLNVGLNTIAVHALNGTKNSTDFSFDAELTVGTSGLSPTPGRRNSVYGANAAPAMSELKQSAQQPAPNTDMVISMKVTDPDGVQGVRFQYQIVNAGTYVRLTDPAYVALIWNSLPMHDDGLDGDAAAGDGVYSIRLPAGWQVNRRLVRYRIEATDMVGNSIRAPYADDPQPNFAYFVYAGIPSWTGANNPGATPYMTFSTDITNSMQAYHLIASNVDVSNSQYVSSYQNTQFYGTIVYDGVVYDHILFKVRGEFSTYQSGKNKWRVDFRTGHEFAARDNYGNLYAEKWRQLNLNANASPWMPVNRGMAGLDEAVAFRLYQLAGLAAPNTNYVQWRVIDDANENPSNQYGGDLWGLYLAVENVGGRFIDEHGLEDGNIYKIENFIGDNTNQAWNQPADGSDWVAWRNTAAATGTPLSWWQANVNLDAFYTFNAINRAVSNVDLREGWNHLMYHAPDGRWQPIPWDLDMLYAPRTQQTGRTYLNNSLVHPAVKTEYANRARELIDLLFSDGSRMGGQVGQLVEEYARMVNEPNGSGGYLTGWAELDQYMWNYNPRTTTPHKGQFYVTPKTDSRFGGVWTRTLPSGNFAGSAQYAINFMTNTDPNGWALNDGDQRGYGYGYLNFEATDGLIPNTPTVTYAGQAGHPVNKLTFSAGAYSHPGGATFAAMEWRVAEISNPNTPGFDASKPWKYEVGALWESGELGAFNGMVTLPAGLLEAGHTYRVRVRVKDATGRWSHWSNVGAGAGTEFVAGASSDALHTSLRITELNYHPADNGPGAPGTAVDAEEYEFIELKNVSNDTISLKNAAFTTGITFTFEDVTLGAGEVGVVVKNKAAFQSRYGTAVKVLGEYPAGGRFDNAGERVVLVDADGQTLFDFTYDDTGTGWYPSTDGEGYSLTVVKNATNPNLSDPASWRPSLAFLGNPGADGLSGDANADAKIDAFDLNVLAANWQTSVTGTTTKGDFNGDGKVDAFDLNILAAFWQSGAALSLTAALASRAAAIETATWEAPAGAVAGVDPEAAGVVISVEPVRAVAVGAVHPRRAVEGREVLHKPQVAEVREGRRALGENVVKGSWLSR